MFFTKAKSNQKISRYVYMVKSRRNRKRQTRRRGGSWRDSLRNRGFYKMVTGDKDVLPELREQFRQQCKKDIGTGETTFQNERIQKFVTDHNLNTVYHIANINDKGNAEKVVLNADTFCGKDDDQEDNIAIDSQYRSKASRYMSRKFRNRIENGMRAFKLDQHVNEYMNGRRKYPFMATEWLDFKKSWRNS